MVREFRCPGADCRGIAGWRCYYDEFGHTGGGEFGQDAGMSVAERHGHLILRG